MASTAGTGGGGEHSISIQMPAGAAMDPVSSDVVVPPRRLSRRRRPAAKPEKSLNIFVRVLATVELAGNAVGTLASLWASVVLLAGSSSSLKRVDFWIAIVMTFIEAFRVFVRNFKLDNKSLFGSTMAFRSFSSSFARVLRKPSEGSQVVLIIGWVLDILNPITLFGIFGKFTRAVVLTLMSRMQLTEAPRLMRQLRRRRPLLLWAVLVVPTLLPWAALFAIFDIVSGADIAFTAHVVATYEAAPVLVQVGAMALLSYRPQRVTDLTSGHWGRRILYLFKVISILSLTFGLAIPTPIYIPIPFITVVLVLGSLQDPAAANSRFGRWIDMIMHLCILLPSTIPFDLLGYIVLLSVLLIGNMQIPVAVAQVVLSSWRLHISHAYKDPNMVASIRVFYGLSACQGSLYIMACILACFSSFPRRSLVHSSGFQGKWAAKAVDLYYERAYTTRMETGVFNIASFVMDSLNSASSPRESEVQLAGVRVLYSLLQRRDSYEEQISEITRSEKVLPTLISMLGWKLEQDKDIRLFATRVVAELSYDLRIVGIPGAVKMVSSLLDAKTKAAYENNEGLLGSQAVGDNEIKDGAGNEPRRQHMLPEAANVNGNNVATNQESPRNAGNSSNRTANEELGHRGGNNKGQCSWACGCCQWMKRKWSIPEERPLTYHDHGSLPILGMVILERLACDPDNCEEILKIRNLIPKIVGFISYSSNNERNNDNALIRSSLNLVRQLVTTSGIGVNIRLQLWECPFLHSNLACVMEDSRSSPDIWKPAVDIIATLALDEGARHELGSVQVIIHRLVHVFIIGHDGATNYDQALRVAAGGALANLAMESPANCLAILEERPGYELVKDLKDMLGNDEYRCVAASLLQNLCACSRICELTHDPGISLSTASPVVQKLAACCRLRDCLRDQGVSDQLSSALPVVLENTMAAEGKQLEALIGLTSQIRYVLPSKGFVQGLESHTNPAGLVKKLVDALNSNRKPSAEFPRMRRVIVEMVISVVESHPPYANIFRQQEMMEALSKVEKTPSKVERYRVFLGHEGLVAETGEPLSDLARRAKGLLVSANLTPGAQPGSRAARGRMPVWHDSCSVFFICPYSYVC
ncbi:hypothetical protein BS78_03G196500 [Paspalum vaginatum]|nr:hypothetical protein BS78_03G196500 [Paspalum vaginatum]